MIESGQVVNPNINPVYRAYDSFPVLVEGMKRYGDIKDPHWLVFANEFIFEIKKNSIVSDFVAKIT